MITVVKCGGGRTLDMSAIAADVAKMVAAGNEVVLVHGGAADIERLGEGLGATTRTLTTPDGRVRRYTDDRAIEVVTLALGGAVKPRWLTTLSGHGIRAIGLTGLDGGCVRARRTPARRAIVDGREVVVRDDHSGRVTAVDADLLRLLLDAGYVPVLSPPAMAEDGRPVNVNADRAAAAVAEALSASALVLLTDAPGVLRDPSDAATVMGVCELPRTGTLPPWAGGGMEMKLFAAREALDAGVPTVVIADGRADEPIRRSLGGSGTRVTLAPHEAAARVAAPPASAAPREHDRQVVELLRGMLEISSPSGEEGRLALFLVARLAEMGVTATRDAVGNLVATTGTGHGPVVLLIGHMDTTPGPNIVREEADRLFGRGAADAKGPLAAMIAAAAARPDFPGTIVVAGAVEEETPGSRGACHLAATLDPPDAVIVGEPGRWSNVVIGYKGKLDLVYRVERPATHPTNPAQKATEAAVEFWRAAVAAAGPRLDHASFDVPGLTLCEMTGDITGASLRISYRTPVGFDDGALLGRLREAAGDGRIEVENSVRAVRTGRANPIVGAFLGAIRAEGGRPRTVVKTATSDMNTLAEVWDCPMATYGPGDNRLGHADDEYIEIDDLLHGVRVLGAALDDFGARWKERALTEDRRSGTPSERQERFFALLKDAAESAERTGPTRRRRQGPARLSFAQESLWFLDHVAPGLSAYNMPYCYRLRGELDVSALRGALAATIRRHDSLRTYLVQEDEGPVQIVVPDIEVPLPVVDVEGPDAASRAYALAHRLVRDPFDLATPPLWRSALYRLGPRDHIFVFVVHHTVFDGWSIGVFVGELEAGYRAAVEGGTAPETPAIQYPDFAEWQREWLRGPNLDRLTRYWRERLSDAPIFELPGDRPRPAQITYSGALVTREFAPDLAPAVAELARAAGTTPYIAFVTAFLTLLQRYTGSDDVVIGSPTAGRDHAELEPLIGFFITMLVLRVDMSGEPTFTELLDRVKDVVNEALDHGNLPFERLVDAVRPERDPARSPLFQIAFTFQNAGDTALRLPGVGAEERTLDLGTSRFDMSWNLYADEAGASIVVEFNTDLYDRATIERLITHYERLMRAMVTEPATTIADAPILTDDELRALLHDFDGPVSPRPETTVTALFERQVDRSPDAVAVTGQEFSLDYAELEARANRLANRLRELGAGPEQIVAICLPRHAELIVAMIAVLKAGAAYLPLDPAHPAGRLRGILDDAEPVAVIADPGTVPRLPTDGPPILRPDDETVTRQPDTRPSGGARPENIAYVLYTSGSTGQPKGVLVTHQNVVNFIGTVQELFRLTPQDRILGYAAAVFDVSVFETFSALLTGARLYVTGDEERLSVALLQRVLEDEGITVIDMPPSVMELLNPESFHALRVAFVGGEAFSGELVNRWNPGRRFFNGYGPTECTVTMIIEECSGHWDDTPPIGLPMANHVAHVLDAKLRPVPFGVPGELVIGGRGLARGYLKRPELTAEKFVKDPFGTAYDGRLYRTGDLVKRLPDGRIVFLGRIDSQVKIRGLRIELGEIESVLAGHAAVRQAVVRLWTDAREDKHLVGYVVSADGRPIDPAALRTHLGEYLPPYMIPGFFAEIDAVPLSASGKVDWARLPEPDVRRSAESRTGPRNETERILAEEIFAPLIGDEAVGVNDNFFLVGGNSLQATQLIFRASRRFGVDVALSEFFRQPTLAQLAVLIDRARLALLSEEEQLARLEAMPDEEVARLLGSPATSEDEVEETGRVEPAAPVSSVRPGDPPEDTAEESERAEPAVPGSPWEELVTTAVSAELELPDLSGPDRFLTLGGHSMAAIRVIASLRRLFGVQLPLRAFMDNGSMAELAGALQQAAVDRLGAEAVERLMAAVNDPAPAPAADTAQEG